MLDILVHPQILKSKHIHCTNVPPALQFNHSPSLPLLTPLPSTPLHIPSTTYPSTPYPLYPIPLLSLVHYLSSLIYYPYPYPPCPYHNLPPANAYPKLLYSLQCMQKSYPRRRETGTPSTFNLKYKFFYILNFIFI